VRLCIPPNFVDRGLREDPAQWPAAADSRIFLAACCVAHALRLS